MIKLPGRLGDDLSTRDSSERVNEWLSVVEYFNVLARGLERRLDIFLANMDAPVSDVPDAKAL